MGSSNTLEKQCLTQNIKLNVTGRNKHVLAIKQVIGTVKERVQAIANQLPFETYSNTIIIEMVYNVIFWLNCKLFHHNDRIHDIMSPRTILTGLRTDHNKHCKLDLVHSYT